jgi:aromatic ring-opening dioxygenase catalytic subunit (LigB family)
MRCACYANSSMRAVPIAERGGGCELARYELANWTADVIERPTFLAVFDLLDKLRTDSGRVEIERAVQHLLNFWAAPGEPALAARVRELHGAAGSASQEDAQRGFDHGVFIPLKVAFPEPTLPTVQLSLDASLDPRKHLELGRTLAPLRDEGVLIVGSGMSFHNMRTLMHPGSAREASLVFDAWLRESCEAEPALREDRLAAWSAAPAARAAHPREEHLLPLMVTAGAAQGETGRCIFRDEVLGAAVSAFEFGAVA